jgi:hypothetical protein
MLLYPLVQQGKVEVLGDWGYTCTFWRTVAEHGRLDYALRAGQLESAVCFTCAQGVHRVLHVPLHLPANLSFGAMHVTK